MTDNAKMVDLPWVDGTTRTVPEWTAYLAASGVVCAARDGGYSYCIDPNNPRRKTIHPHSTRTVAVRIFTEAPEPPVKVNVPTGLGAIVSLVPPISDDPGYVLTRDGWRGLRTYTEYDPSEIADRLRNGARVLFEGIDEDTP